MLATKPQYRIDLPASEREAWEAMQREEQQIEEEIDSTLKLDKAYAASVKAYKSLNPQESVGGSRPPPPASVVSERSLGKQSEGAARPSAPMVSDEQNSLHGSRRSGKHMGVAGPVADDASAAAADDDQVPSSTAAAAAKAASTGPRPAGGGSGMFSSLLKSVEQQVARQSQEASSATFATAGGLENSGNPLLFRHTLYQASSKASAGTETVPGSSASAGSSDSTDAWDAARGEDLLVKAPAFGPEASTVTMRCSFYRLKGEERIVSLVHVKRPQQNPQTEVAAHVSIRLEPPRSGSGPETMSVQLGYRHQTWSTQRRMFGGRKMLSGGPGFPVHVGKPFWLRIVFTGRMVLLYLDSEFTLASDVDPAVGLQPGAPFEVVGACTGDYGERSSLRIEGVWVGKCAPGVVEMQQATTYLAQQKQKAARKAERQAAGGGAGAGDVPVGGTATGAVSGGVGIASGGASGVALSSASGLGAAVTVLIAGIPPDVDEGAVFDFFQVAGVVPRSVDMTAGAGAGGHKVRAVMANAVEAATAVAKLATVPLAGRRVALRVV